jgi:hypothetical protein
LTVDGRQTDDAGVSAASLVLGILGTIFSLWPLPPLFWLGVPLALIGLVLAIVARKSQAANGQPTGTATAGLVMNVIALVIGGTLAVWCASCFRDFQRMADNPDALMVKMREIKSRREFERAYQEALRASEAAPDASPKK